jgi:hypothetical protein
MELFAKHHLSRFPGRGFQQCMVTCTRSPQWQHVASLLQGTKQLKLDPTIYDALQKEKVCSTFIGGAHAAASTCKASMAARGPIASVSLSLMAVWHVRLYRHNSMR